MTKKQARLIWAAGVFVVAAGIAWRVFTHVTFPDCLRPYADRAEFVQRQAVWDEEYVQVTTTYSVNEPAELLVVELYGKLGEMPGRPNGPRPHHQSERGWWIESGKAKPGGGTHWNTKPDLGLPDWSMVCFFETRKVTSIESFMGSFGLAWVGWHYGSGADPWVCNNEGASERLGAAIARLRRG
jgi:hypothetical protein